MLQQASAAPGWYGKLSMLGDFASRRLDAAWVRRCDGWLSEGLLASRQALGERWLPTYLAAPAWRFAWGPGAFDGSDARWWFGVLMPSCDSVGRYYPLLLAQPRAHPPADRAGLEHLHAWWSHLAHAALATLADGASVQALEETLAQAPPWPPATRAEVGQPAAGTAGMPLPLGHAVDAAAADAADALSAGGLIGRLAGASAWWPVAAPGAAVRPACWAGLPSPQAFVQLLRPV